MLGPLLFILFINDIFSVLKKASIMAYADDKAVIFKGKTWYEVTKIIKTDFPKLLTWFTNNRLSINMEKTVFIPFGCYKNSLPQINKIKLVTETKTFYLNRTDDIKYLGIIFDSNMKCEQHVNKICNSTRYMPYIFKKLKPYFNIEQLKLIYYALFLSIASYGIIAWGGALWNVMKKLEKLHKNIIKVIFKLERKHSTEDVFNRCSLFDMKLILGLADH